MRWLDRATVEASTPMKIDPCRLAFDIDGVVADTMSLFLDIGRQEYGLFDVGYEDITGWDLAEKLNIRAEIVEEIIDRILNGDYRMPLHALDGAADVLSRIGRRCGSLLMVTARPHPGPIDKWMREQLDLEPGSIDIVCTGSFEAKVDILHERKMTFFIEDRLDTCFILDEAGLVPILYKQPWNREQHPFVEVGSWHELDALIAY